MSVQSISRTLASLEKNPSGYDRVGFDRTVAFFSGKALAHLRVKPGVKSERIRLRVSSGRSPGCTTGSPWKPGKRRLSNSTQAASIAGREGRVAAASR